MDHLPLTAESGGNAVARSILEKLDSGALFIHASDARVVVALLEDAEARATEAEAVARRVTDPTLEHLRMENGAIDLALSGPLVQHMGLVITEHFRAMDAENYLEMTYTTKTEPYESFNWTIRKQVGENSPHQLRMKAERELVELRDRLAAPARAWLAVPQDGSGTSVITDPLEAAEMASHPNLWRVHALIEGEPLPSSRD